MIFAPAALQDLPAIVDLVNGAYRGDNGQYGWTHEAEYLDGPRTSLAALEGDLLASPDAVLLTLRDAPLQEILGCVWLESAGEGVWYLGLLTVRVDQQNRHLGRILLEGAEAEVRHRGGNRIRMTVVNLRDTLIEWYQRRGYEATGEVQDFPYGDNRFGTPNRDDLAFIVMEKGV